jgi:hypothetical protein
MRISASVSAMTMTTTICHRLLRTTVRGSVIMKKMNS